MPTNIFLDRDGVINEVIMRGGIAASPRHVGEFIVRDEFIRFYKEIEPRALKLFVVSNQPDVSRRLMQAAELAAMNARMQQFAFEEIVYCLHDDGDRCRCRKPKPGMISDLVDKYGLDKEQSILIGDSPKDVLAGQAAGIRTVYLRSAYNQQAVFASPPDFIVDSLGEILGIIS